MNRAARRILLFAALGLLIAGCSGEETSGPGQAVETFYDRLNAGEYVAAKALYTAEMRDMLGDPASASDSGFVDWAKTATRDGTIDSVRITQEQTDEEGGATVEYEIVYRDGSTAQHNVTMKLEEGAWRLGLVR
jgi:hypothetical protein